MQQARAALSLHIDFDRTLFDTPRWARIISQEIAARTRLSLEQVTAAAEKFYTHPVFRSFDFAGYVASLHLDVEAMWRFLDELMNRDHFLYPDSTDFMQSLRRDGFNPRILSFGEERFQRAKIMPVLRELVGEGSPLPEVEIIFRPKGEFLTATYPGMHGALVDDVPSQNLPQGFTEIHIDRELSLAAPQQKDGGYTVATLAQARTVIEQLAANTV